MNQDFVGEVNWVALPLSRGCGLFGDCRIPLAISARLGPDVFKVLGHRDVPVALLVEGHGDRVCTWRGLWVHSSHRNSHIPPFTLSDGAERVVASLTANLDFQMSTE